MRILILNWKDLAHPSAGGAEVFTDRVSRELASRGHEVTLFVGAVADEPEEETENGVRIIRRGSRLGVYRAARKFWHQQGAAWADVVIDEVNTRPFLTPRYVRNVPVLALFHQVAREVWRFETPFPISTLGRHVFEPHWLRSYREIPTITVSESSARSLAQYGLRNVAAIRNGSDQVRIQPVAAKAEVPTVVFLGRLARMKQPGHAIAAVEQLRTVVPDARIWIVGDGPMRSELVRDQRAWIEVLGRVSTAERERRLSSAHVHVATSIREGWGLNVSEAAARGTPTIGYRSPGLVDSIPASGGATVDSNPKALACALSAFFAGDLVLQPKISTVPWRLVADAVEEHLVRALTGDPEP